MNIKILAIFTVILILGVGIYISNENNLNTGDQVYSPDLPDLKDEFDSNATAYQITDTTGLVNLSSLSAEGNTFEGKTIFLANDLDMSGIEFVPIGNSSSSKMFKGIFDGQEYEISNLTITGDVPTGDTGPTSYVGLFGYFGSGGTVRNVALVDSSINALPSNYFLPILVGGIAGGNDGTISNCYNTGDVTSNAFAGGIAGDNYGGTIQNCYNTGTVSATSTSSNAYAGGIAGDNAGGMIQNCYNTGDVAATSTSPDAFAGGIAGDNYGGTIQNCYNTGTVSATSTSSNAYAGGIAGDNAGGMIQNCYALQTDSKGIHVTSDELKSASILAALGSAYKANTSSLNGYPILAWQCIYTVSFDSQNDSTIESLTTYEGHSVIKPSDPTKNNKLFWYWASNDKEFDFSSPITSDTTLTAVWYDKLFFTGASGASA